MIRNSTSVSVLAVAALVATSGIAVACAEYDDVVAAVQGNNATQAAELYEAISVSAACDDKIREWVGDFLARDAFLTAMEVSSPDDQRDSLERALGYEKHWRSYSELGRVDWRAKNYAPAAANFQLAINELIDGDPNHEAEEEEIAELYQLASAAMALADTPVELPRTRSGNIGGIFETKIRGFSVEEVPLPITFEYNSTAFDTAGKSYASVLVEHLRQSAPTSVSLAGHTDPRGGEEFNLTLSEARATALKDFLREGGFEGEIEVTGFGESQVPPAPDGIEVDSDEHYRIARRVAFKTN